MDENCPYCEEEIEWEIICGYFESHHTNDECKCPHCGELFSGYERTEVYHSFSKREKEPALKKRRKVSYA